MLKELYMDPTACPHVLLSGEDAERIARDEHGSDKISVISGVGVRSYYRKLGYWLDGPYMSKWLDGRPQNQS